LNYIRKNGIINSGYKNTNKKQIKVRRMDMKKSNLIKIVLVLCVSLMVMLFSTNVMAAEEIDLTKTLNNMSNNTNTNTNNTNNTNRNTNNSSIYNNTSLPKTGITDSIPVAVLLVVFGISSVYAYKKIKDYKNI